MLKERLNEKDETIATLQATIKNLEATRRKKSFVILTNTVLWITQLSDDSTTATLRKKEGGRRKCRSWIRLKN